jgi:hypothetical protein
MKPITYIAIKVAVNYWEDATVNGVEDVDGSLVPCTVRSMWNPVVRLSDGVIVNWTEGTTAEIHYKVVDSGSYYLLDADRNVLYRKEGDYVPSDVIDTDRSGWGDYIIWTVDEKGRILNWRNREIDLENWEKSP